MIRNSIGSALFAVSLVGTTACYAQQQSGVRPAQVKGVQIVSIDNQPVPDEFKVRVKKKALAMRTKDVVDADDNEIPDFDVVVADVGRKLRPFDATFVDTVLHIRPANLERSSLNGAKIIGAHEGGTKLPTGWTGLTRVIVEPTLGKIVLDELDFVASGSGFSLTKEMLNSDVNGNPATVLSQRTHGDRTMTTVTWVTSSKRYRLRAKQVGHDVKEKLLEIARSISD